MSDTMAGTNRVRTKNVSRMTEIHSTKPISFMIICTQCARNEQTMDLGALN